MAPKPSQYKGGMDWKNTKKKGQVGLDDWVSGGGDSSRLDKVMRPEEQLGFQGRQWG